MSEREEQRNKATVRRFVDEVVNAGRSERLEDLIAANFLGAEPGSPRVLGPYGVRELLARHRRAIPDLEVRVMDLIAEQDRVAIAWVATGTPDRSCAGGPPSGTALRCSGTSIVRLLAGRLVECRTTWLVTPSTAAAAARPTAEVAL